VSERWTKRRFSLSLDPAPYPAQGAGVVVLPLATNTIKIIFTPTLIVTTVTLLTCRCGAAVNNLPATATVLAGSGDSPG
jgi:hypothetical protein